MNSSGLIVQGDAEATLPADGGAEASKKGTKDSGGGAALVGDPDASSSPPSGSCTLHQSFSSAACDACMQASCCQVVNTCFDDPDCSALTQCEVQCLNSNDPNSCATACESRYSSKVQDFNAWLACGDQSCQVDCQ